MQKKYSNGKGSKTTIPPGLPEALHNHLKHLKLSDITVADFCDRLPRDIRGKCPTVAMIAKIKSGNGGKSDKVLLAAIMATIGFEDSNGSPKPPNDKIEHLLPAPQLTLKPKPHTVEVVDVDEKNANILVSRDHLREISKMQNVKVIF